MAQKKAGGKLQILYICWGWFKWFILLLPNAIIGCVAPPPRRQILILGPASSGKTTLLYRLKIPSWKFVEMADAPPFDPNADKRREEDPGYHYEEFTSRDGMEYGVWDLPGDLWWQRLWPTFYRFQAVSAVIFVVDGQDEDPLNLQRAKASFRQLLAEDELRNAAFVVIVNDKKRKLSGKDGAEGVTIAYNQADDFWKFELGIDEDMDRLHWSVRPAVSFHVFDFKDVRGFNDDPNWASVMGKIHNHIIRSEA
jgi:signal recognition particle receptor subunit beta